MSLQPNTPPRLWYQLMVATLGRIVINSAQRMFYPFLPAFSRGLGVPIEDLRVILSLRGAFGMTAPFFGPMIERVGQRNAMLIGMSIFSLGLAAAGIFPNIWTVGLAIVLVVACKFLFEPAFQAYLGEHVPYAKRGLVIGITEFGWSGAILIGAPLVGLLIERVSWRAPFIIIAGLGVVAALWTATVIPKSEPAAIHTKGNGFRRWWSVIRNPVILGALTVDLLISAANEGISVVYSEWLETSFGLTVVQLGLSAIAIGIAELVAEGGVAGLSDKLGKRQTVILGLAASALAYFFLPFTAGNLNWAVVGIFLVYFAFEFAIVAMMPLISELDPNARSTVMSTTIASHAAGRMIGALLGGFLFQYSFIWNGIVYGIMTLIGIPLIIWVVREAHIQK
jgi:predicted MFS family arabinose efflux permease